MFWNVRAMPQRRDLVRRHAGDVPPSSTTVPSVAWYSPVSTLKNVVLPAPLGPIRLTMPPRGMVN